MRTFYFLWCILFIVMGGCKKSGSSTPAPTSEVKAPPSGLGLNAFYKKYVDAGGIPIISSDKVDDQALLNARDIVNHMLKLIPDVKAKMIANKIRVGIIGKTERPTQMPEYSDLYTAFPGTDWDKRARAYGATPERPLTTDCEENMLCLSNDMYHGEELMTHEFAHAIHELGLSYMNVGFDSKLQAAFSNAQTKGLWKNTYAIGEIHEYWAEGVQSWFNCNLEASPANGVHNEINTRAELKTYDSMLYDLIKTYFADDSQKHGCY